MTEWRGRDGRPFFVPQRPFGGALGTKNGTASAFVASGDRTWLVSNRGEPERGRRLDKNRSLGRDAGRGVPKDVVERAKAAFPLRTPPGELIPLTAAVTVDADDTLVEQRLTFERNGLFVRVSVVASDDAARVQVDVDPPEFQAVKLEVQKPRGGVKRIPPDRASSPSRRSRRDDQGTVTFLLPLAIVRLHILGSPVSAHLYSEWFRL